MWESCHRRETCPVCTARPAYPRPRARWEYGSVEDCLHTAQTPRGRRRRGRPRGVHRPPRGGQRRHHGARRREQLRGHGRPAGDGPAVREDRGVRLGRQADRHVLRQVPRVRPARPDRPHHEEGDHRHRGLPLLRARRPRPQGHPPRTGLQRRVGDDAGRLHADPAVRQEPAGRRRQDEGGVPRGDRAHRRPQGPRTPLRAGHREADVQGRDPRGLPEHRLLRCGRIRSAGGRQALLQHPRQRTRPRAGRAPGGHHPEPHGLRPDPQPQGRA